MAFSVVTLTGHYTDEQGNPLNGTVTFQLTSNIFQAGVRNIAAVPIQTPVVSGGLSVSLLATNDPTTQPIDAAYQVIEAIAGAPTNFYYIVVPYTSGGTSIDIGSCVRVLPTPVPNNNYVTAAAMEAAIAAGGGESSGAPTGPAGGVLSGTYPDPGVVDSIFLPGVPTAPTASIPNSTEQLATTAFVNESLSAGQPFVAPVAAVATVLPVDYVSIGGIETPSGIVVASGTADGYTIQNGDRILIPVLGPPVLMGQPNVQAANGIWVVNFSGPWTRPPDYASGFEFTALSVLVRNGVFRGNTIWSCVAPSGTVFTVDSSTTATWQNAAHSDPTRLFMSDFIEPPIAGVDPFQILAFTILPLLPQRTVGVPQGSTYTNYAGTIEWPTMDFFVGFSHDAPDTGPWVRMELNGAHLYYLGGKKCAVSVGAGALNAGRPANDIGLFAGVPRCTGGWNGGVLDGTFAGTNAAFPYGPIGYHLDAGERWDLEIDIMGFGQPPQPTVIPIPVSTGALPSGFYSVVTANATIEQFAQPGIPSAVQQVKIPATGSWGIQVTTPDWVVYPSGALTPGSTIYLANGRQQWAPGNTNFVQLLTANNGAQPSGGSQSQACPPGYVAILDATNTSASGRNPTALAGVGLYCTHTFNWNERVNVRGTLKVNQINMLFDGLWNGVGGVNPSSFEYSDYDFTIDASPASVGVMAVGGAWLNHNRKGFALGGVFYSDNLGNAGFALAAGDPYDFDYYFVGGVNTPPSYPNGSVGGWTGRTGGNAGWSNGTLKLVAECQTLPGLQATTLGPGGANVVSGTTYFGAGDAVSLLTISPTNAVVIGPTATDTIVANAFNGLVYVEVPLSGGGFVRVKAASLGTVTIPGFSGTYYAAIGIQSVTGGGGGAGTLDVLGTYAYLLGCPYAASSAAGHLNTQFTMPSTMFVANHNASSIGSCYVLNMDWKLDFVSFTGTNWGTLVLGEPAATALVSGTGGVQGAPAIIARDSTHSGPAGGPFATQVQNFTV